MCQQEEKFAVLKEKLITAIYEEISEIPMSAKELIEVLEWLKVQLFVINKRD